MRIPNPVAQNPRAAAVGGSRCSFAALRDRVDPRVGDRGLAEAVQLLVGRLHHLLDVHRSPVQQEHASRRETGPAVKDPDRLEYGDAQAALRSRVAVSRVDPERRPGQDGALDPVLIQDDLGASGRPRVEEVLPRHLALGEPLDAAQHRGFGGTLAREPAPHGRAVRDAEPLLEQPGRRGVLVEIIS